MIDVWAVAANALWVLGLSVVLAALSWAHWAASQEATGIRMALRRARLRRALHLGLLLFCGGLAASSTRWWERVVWGILAASWLVQTATPGHAGTGEGCDGEAPL